MRKDIESLHPLLQPLVKGILSELEAKGWQPVIGSAWRSIEEQAEIVRKGHSKVFFSFHNASFPDGTPASLAADIVDKRYYWNTEGGIDHPFWHDLGEAARSRGLIWGNDWDNDGVNVPDDPDERFADVAHVQLLPNNMLGRVRSGWIPKTHADLEVTKSDNKSNGFGVKDWQKFLITKVFINPGSIDGIWGAKTEKATRVFFDSKLGKKIDFK